MEIVKLAKQVMPERAVIELQGGMLKFDLPIAATNEV
jgi:hypothetical protein